MRRLSLLRYLVMSSTFAISMALVPSRSHAYSGGPLQDVTDSAPYCAGCHSSTDLGQLRDLPPAQAERSTSEKHLQAIKAGTGPYAKLSQQQRDHLAADVQRVDSNSRVSLEVPSSVKAGANFDAIITAQGGSGPVFGVMLLDVDLRNQARPIEGEGFEIVSAPEVIGPDGKPQDDWLKRRYDSLARNLNFVVVFGVKADLAANQFSSARVNYKLVAPQKPGKYTICAAFLYGTEKASPAGRVESEGHVTPVGGFAGSSGRIEFSALKTVEVQ